MHLCLNRRCLLLVQLDIYSSDGSADGRDQRWKHGTFENVSFTDTTESASCGLHLFKGQEQQESRPQAVVRMFQVEILTGIQACGDLCPDSRSLLF